MIIIMYTVCSVSQLCLPFKAGIELTLYDKIGSIKSK